MAATFQTSIYPGFEIFAEMHGTPSAIVIPPNSTLVFTGGIVGPVADNQLVFGDSIDQLRKGLENVEKAIRAAAPHLTPEEARKSIFRLVSYHVDLERQEWEPIGQVAKEFFGDHKPTWAAFVLETHPYPGCKFEILASAAIKS